MLPRILVTTLPRVTLFCIVLTNATGSPRAIAASRSGAPYSQPRAAFSPNTALSFDESAITFYVAGHPIHSPITLGTLASYVREDRAFRDTVVSPALRARYAASPYLRGQQARGASFYDALNKYIDDVHAIADQLIGQHRRGVTLQQGALQDDSSFRASVNHELIDISQPVLVTDTSATFTSALGEPITWSRTLAMPIPAAPDSPRIGPTSEAPSPENLYAVFAPLLTPGPRKRLVIYGGGAAIVYIGEDVATVTEEIHRAVSFGRSGRDPAGLTEGTLPGHLLRQIAKTGGR